MTLARARPTAASWKRLLRASKNLKAAMHEHQRARVGGYAPSPTGEQAPGASPSEPRSTRAEPTRAHDELPPGASRDLARRTTDLAAERAAVAREWERSRRLIEWARRLASEEQEREPPAP